MSHDDYTFVCPQCEEAMSVNAPMREALMANGCVVCGAAVTGDAFTEATDLEV